MKLERVAYEQLTSRQKEIFNFQKAAAKLADYGFNCIKLDATHQVMERIRRVLDCHSIGQTTPTTFRVQATLKAAIEGDDA